MSIIKFKNEEALNQAGLVIDATTGEAMPALQSMTTAVNRRCVKLKKMLGEAQAEIVGIGKDLITIRAYLHERRIPGGFDAWLSGEFEWSRTQAYRLIAIAQAFSECPNLGHYDQSAMYLLAAPSTPSAAKEEAKQIAESGEFVDYTTAAELIDKFRPGDHEESENEAVAATAPQEASGSVQPTTEDDSVEVLRPMRKTRTANPVPVVPREHSAWESHVMERAKQFQVKGQVDCLVGFLESFGVQPSL